MSYTESGNIAGTKSNIIKKSSNNGTVIVSPDEIKTAIYFDK